MPSSHRRLRPDRQPGDRRAGRARRLDRLDGHAALRQPGLLRRAARRARARPLAGRAGRRARPRSRARYRDGSTVLETRFETADGEVSVIDFMARRDGASDLMRIVRGVRGRVAMRTELVVRFDYGAVVPWVSRQDDGRLHFTAGPGPAHAGHAASSCAARTCAPSASSRSARATRSTFSLTWQPLVARRPAGARRRRRRWRRSRRSGTRGRRKLPEGDQVSEAVRRSLVTLKALAHWETGGIVAAATTSLPEKIGGTRNWDYRFCWLRDATFTLYALLGPGLRRRGRGLARVAGARGGGQPGRPADHVRRGRRAPARRVRGAVAARLRGLGAGARRQRRRGPGAARRLRRGAGRALRRAQGRPRVRRDAAGRSSARWSSHLETIWDQPDDGIWEVRGGRRHFTHSKVMAWVAFDRAVRSATEFGLEGAGRALARGARRDPRAGLRARLRRGAGLVRAVLRLERARRQPAADRRSSASCRPTTRASAARSPRSRSGLLRDGLVLRYDTGDSKDGLPPGEGAFLACSFWLADNYLLQGRVDEAQAAVRPPARLSQRRRPAGRGIRPGRASASSATSRRRSRTSR